MIADQDLEIVMCREPDLMMLWPAISTGPGMFMFAREALFEQVLMTHSRQRAIDERLIVVRPKKNGFCRY